MADASALATASYQTVQLALQVVQTLQLTSWRFPLPCNPKNGSSFDFIVVGAGSAGSVLANRLSANCDVSVLLIEAGGPSPIEADMAGLFPLLTNSLYDYNFTSINDNYTAQNLQGHHVFLTQGKMIGGSGALNHLIHAHGHPNDYNQWAKMLNDSVWKFTNILPYFIKLEKLVDKKLLASASACHHGTEGPIKIARQLSCCNEKFFDAFEELGHRIVDDVSTVKSRLGYAEPLLAIADGVRQSSSTAYLGDGKLRHNLCIVMHTTATKILIKNGTAIGVQVIDPNGAIQVFFAKKEVIVSAGAFNSPKLLMLSGIGPQDHLNSLGIDVIANLPVGKNFQDRATAFLFYQMERDTSTTPAVNPLKFPIPITVGYVALNSSQMYPDYQSINLVFPHDSAAFFQFCFNMYKYSYTLCNTLYKATIGRTTLFSIINLMMPDSRGEVLLASADVKDDPLVYTGTYRNSSDLKLMAASLADFNKILQTSYFKSVDAKLVDTGLCTNTSTANEFWECNAIATSSSLWHFVGTCAMGLVLDSRLRVKGVSALRVVDSSSLPTEVRGNPNAAIMMVAERAADFILEAWNIPELCSTQSQMCSKKRTEFCFGKICST